MVDWYAAKQEYITTRTSYRKLCEKYGVSGTELGRRARKEDWVGERKKYFEKTLAKTLNALSSAQAARAARLQTVADKLLNKVEKAVELIDEDSLDTQAFRQIASSLKDIKDIQMIKSDADIREQEARIANLQRQPQDGDKSGDIKITIEGNLEDYSI